MRPALASPVGFTLGFSLAVVCLFGCQHPGSIGRPSQPLAAESQSSGASESERLTEWFDARYEEKLSRSPMTLTTIGRKDKQDQIDDMSEAAGDELLQWQENSVKELQTRFDYDALTDDAKISYDIWVYQYEDAKAVAPFRRHRYVFTQMSGVHARLPNFLINQHRVEDARDMRAYIARISGIARAIDQLVERARLGANEGVRPPRFAHQAVIEESKKLLAGRPFEPGSDEDAPLWAAAKKKIAALLEADAIGQTTASELRAAARAALLQSFEPAYLNLIAWIEADRELADRVPRGVGSLKDGRAFYDSRLAHATTTSLTAEEIHHIGLSEVSRIRKEMEALKEQVGFRGSLAEFFSFVRSDEAFLYPNDDEGRQAYLDDSTAYLEQIHSRLPDFFGLLPKAALVVKRVESFREQDGAPQHYMRGTLDGSRPGVYYAHLSDMTAMPKNEMEAVAYHEGNPGHHMQISIAQELTGVPKFRTRAFFTSYVEGWALYAELLAKEMGAYQSPYADFGRMLTEMWRAIRLVVDTGLHSKGWSEEEAVAYFKANSAISLGQIRAEVRRYLVWPGQATSYKIGMLKILELRARAKAELGDGFDIRDFHDTVLAGGAVPLSVLERRVDNWIAAAEGQ